MVLDVFVPSVHAQPPLPPDSTSGIAGLADTPDHPVLLQKKGRSTGEKILRSPAKTIRLLFEGLIHVVGSPLSIFARPTLVEEVQMLGRWLSENHLYMGDGGQGDGSSVGLEIGVKGQVGQVRPLTATLSSAMTIRTYQTHALRVQQVLNSRAALHLWGQYRIRSRENFYGIGQGSLLTNQSRYSQKDINGGLAVSYQVSRVGITWTGEWSDYRIHDGSGDGLPPTSHVFPGLSGSNGAKLFSTGAGVRFPLVLYRKAGWDTGLEASMRAYWDTDGGGFGFNRYTVSLYQAAPLFWDDRILGIRVSGIITEPHERKSIPFFMLPHLGGSSDLRGFDTLRFRDRKALVMNAEYRYPLWDIGITQGAAAGMAADIVLFADTGMVFDSFDRDFKSGNLSTDYGGGLRFRMRQQVMGRIIVARGSEALRIVVKIGKDF